MKRIIFIFLLTGFFSCPLFAQSKITDEEYKIYAVVLKEIYKEEFKNTKQRSSLVILNKTVSPEFFDDYDDKKMKGLTKDFGRKNKSTINLEKRFPIKLKNYIVGKNELDRLLEIGGKNVERIEIESKKNKRLPVIDWQSDVIWKPFHEKFPKSNGYYTFSRIGFSSTKKFAVLQVNGEGAYWSSYSTYILIKTKKGWRIYTASLGRSIA